MKVVSLPYYQKLHFLIFLLSVIFWYLYLIDKVVSLTDCFLGAAGNYHLDNFLFSIERLIDLAWSSLRNLIYQYISIFKVMLHETIRNDGF